MFFAIGISRTSWNGNHREIICIEVCNFCIVCDLKNQARDMRVGKTMDQVSKKHIFFFGVNAVILMAILLIGMYCEGMQD